MYEIKKFATTGICLVYLLLSPLAFATFATDRDHPLNILANSADINRADGTNIYHGNVKIDQGDTHIRGDKVTTHFNKNKVIEEIIIEGNPGEAWTKISMNKPEIHGRAQIIHYYPQSKKLLLQKQAQIQQGSDIIRGETISYDLQTHHLSSIASPGARTTIVMQTTSKTTSKKSL